MSDENVNFNEISIDNEEFLHNYLKNINIVSKFPLLRVPRGCLAKFFISKLYLRRVNLADAPLLIYTLKKLLQ